MSLHGLDAINFHQEILVTESLFNKQVNNGPIKDIGLGDQELGDNDSLGESVEDDSNNPRHVDNASDEFIKAETKKYLEQAIGTACKSFSGPTITVRPMRHLVHSAQNLTAPWWSGDMKKKGCF